METGPAPCKLLGMTRKQLQLWLGAAAFLCPPGGLLLTLLSPVVAQDIRGLELCTAETRMERRTGCLQANIEFLQQALIKLARETRDKITAADRDIAVARAEIASLKATTEKLNSELAQMKANAQPKTRSRQQTFPVMGWCGRPAIQVGNGGKDKKHPMSEKRANEPFAMR